MDALRRATMEDVRKAVNTDGSIVDVYRVIAAKMLGLPYERVKDSHRAAAKRAAFYGRYSVFGGTSV